MCGEPSTNLFRVAGQGSLGSYANRRATVQLLLVPVWGHLKGPSTVNRVWLPPPGTCRVGVFSEERLLNTRNTLALFSAKLIK